MMNQIKHALAFIFGSVYTSAFITVTSSEYPSSDGRMVSAAIFVFLGGIVIISLTVGFFLAHWKED